VGLAPCAAHGCLAPWRGFGWVTRGASTPGLAERAGRGSPGSVEQSGRAARSQLPLAMGPLAATRWCGSKETPPAIPSPQNATFPPRWGRLGCVRWRASKAQNEIGCAGQDLAMAVPGPQMLLKPSNPRAVCSQVEIALLCQAACTAAAFSTVVTHVPLRGCPREPL